MHATAITPTLYYIGAFDPELRTFDIIMKTANGTSYNSYLIKGSDGIAIVDTVKEKFAPEFLAKIESVASFHDIRYIILNHLEPDHSGALPALLEKAPQAKVIVSVKAKPMFKAMIESNIEFDTVKTGNSISLGDRTLEFISTPFLHWPETMMTYLPEERVLFSCDAFGAHYYDTRIFNDQVGDFDYAFSYYYNHIMKPYKSYVNSALDAISKLPLQIIAPSHGPVLRHNISSYLDRYKEWSRPKVSLSGKKQLYIFYASSYGNTRRMAEAILAGLNTFRDLHTTMFDLEALEFENGLHLLDEADAFLVGSPTINGDAVKPVWDLLSGLAFVETRGKMAASFGSFGWGGEATAMISDRLRSLRIQVPMEPLRVKLIPHQTDLAACRDFGIAFAEHFLNQQRDKSEQEKVTNVS